jgi:hypothetical protein
MPTETITLQYGPTAAGIYGLSASSFAWTVTNVATFGTFIDGTPWIVMGSTGSVLTNILPRSEQKTTDYTTGTYQIVNVYINGSAKNPKTPYGSYNPNTMVLSNELGVFDSRIKLLPGTGTQAFIDSLYGLTFNIGYTSGGINAPLNPVGLTFNDVIITADSMWFDENHPLYGATLYTGPSDGTKRIGLGTSIPNTIGLFPTSGGNGTPLKRLGVLNVLPNGFTGITQSYFRPPAQWKSDTSDRYNFLIPVSAARGITEIANIFGHTTTNQNIYEGIPYRSNQYLDSIFFHSGNEIRRSSTVGVNCTENISLINGNDYEMYPMLDRTLLDMTNKFNTISQRELSRNRFIQYGIDALGAVISGVQSSIVTGGHRNSELLPPILITSWLLGPTYGSQFLDIYNTIRSNFPGLSGYSDESVGDYFFTEWTHYSGVTTNQDMGRYMRQTWSPTGPNGTYVTSAEITTKAYFHDDNVGSTFGSGKYGKLNVAGGNFPSSAPRGFYRHPPGSQRGASFYNYPGCYLKITGGAGSGSTVYKIIEVGKVVSSSQESGADYVIVDRPWINGTPDATSVVECYPFRNGIHAFDGSTADLGRYYYNGTSSTKYTSEGINYGPASSHSLSYKNTNYGQQQWQGRLIMHTFLTKIFEITGSENYIKFNSFKWYTDAVLGYNRYLGDNSLLGTTPRQEYIQHLKWNEIYGNTAYGSPDYNVRLGRAGKTRIPILEQWMGITGATQFGKAEWSTFPGYALSYDAQALARVLGNWGYPGNTDFNGDGNTDSQDLVFLLDRWET